MSLDTLEGLIPTEVGETLAHYAAQVKQGLAIVELGSYKGKSTCYLASATSNPVYAVDAWNLPHNVNGRFGFAQASTLQRFREQTADYPNITYIQDYTTRAGEQWTGWPVGLLYVDADHSYESVMADVNAWVKHLDPDAVVILDDWGTPKNPGVRHAAEDLVKLLGPYEVEAGRLAVFSP